MGKEEGMYHRGCDCGMMCHYHEWRECGLLTCVRVVKPNLLFCVHQRNSEGICRGEWQGGGLSGA